MRNWSSVPIFWHDDRRRERLVILFVILVLSFRLHLLGVGSGSSVNSQ